MRVKHAFKRWNGQTACEKSIGKMGRVGGKSLGTFFAAVVFVVVVLRFRFLALILLSFQLLLTVERCSGKKLF